MEIKLKKMDLPEIVYEDKSFLGVYKPAGLLVHASSVKRQEEDTLVKWLVKKYPEIKQVGDDPKMRPGIVHRLDRETSGIMIVARTPEYFEYLKKLFRTRAIAKEYFALVRGVPKLKSAVISKPIGIKTGTLKRSVRSEKMLKEAVTEYRIFKNCGGCSLLKIFPKTGRTHQIRVHLASIGHPIAGDSLYGNYKPGWTDRLYLHAFAIEFSSAPGRIVRLESELPSEFELACGLAKK